jgi:MFS transporter, FHS family, glucose/mannose:H+ symporter
MKLQDDQAGLLLLLAWLGSSFGALLLRGSLRTVLTAGSALIAGSALGLSGLPGGYLKGLFLLYGLGLGVTMTTISVLCQQNVHSKDVELIRLNLAWAVGACVCPSLALHATLRGDPKPLLLAFGLYFGAFSLWTIRTLPSGLRLKRKETAQRPMLQSTPLYLIVMSFLITGIEAAFGGWLTIYAGRTHHGLSITVAAPTCFWAGLLLSRFTWALFGMTVRTGQLMRGSLWLITWSSILLIATTSSIGVLVAAFCLGFGLGPVYPVLLALALDFKESGVIFFVAGLGSACLPWLTGLISNQYASLPIGLFAPATAATLMLALAFMFPFRKSEVSCEPTREPT